MIGMDDYVRSTDAELEELEAERRALLDGDEGRLPLASVEDFMEAHLRGAT